MVICLSKSPDSIKSFALYLRNKHIFLSVLRSVLDRTFCLQMFYSNLRYWCVSFRANRYFLYTGIYQEYLLILLYGWAASLISFLLFLIIDWQHQVTLIVITLAHLQDGKSLQWHLKRSGNTSAQWSIWSCVCASTCWLQNCSQSGRRKRSAAACLTLCVEDYLMGDWRLVCFQTWSCHFFLAFYHLLWPTMSHTGAQKVIEQICLF